MLLHCINTVAAMICYHNVPIIHVKRFKKVIYISKSIGLNLNPFFTSNVLKYLCNTNHNIIDLINVWHETSVFMLIIIKSLDNMLS